MAHHLPDDVTDDVTIEILCRLPRQGLARFKCVCKAWNALISYVCIPRISPPSGFFFWNAEDGYFQRPLRELGNIMEFLPYPSGDGDVGVDVQTVKSYYKLLPREYSPYDFLDHCHGLILLVSKSAARYFVRNPAIKQCVALPNQDNVADVRSFQAALAFRPAKSSHYKVVRFICGPSNYPPEVSVFSSETKEWIRKKLAFTPPVASGFRFPWSKRTIYLDGMLFKLTLQKHLLCFDLGALTVRTIDLPLADRIDEYGFIGVSKGNLVFSNFDGPKILIWQLDYTSKAGCFWSLRHSICLHDLITKNLEETDLLKEIQNYSTLVKIYAIHPACDIVFIGTPTRVYKYNLQSQKLEVLYRGGSNARNIILGQFFFYLYYPCNIKLNEFNG